MVRFGVQEHLAADAGGTRQAALDLELRYLPVIEIDFARFDLWTQRIAADAMAGDTPAVAGDVATIEWVWDRIAHTVEGSTAGEIETRLTALRVAIDAGNLDEATGAAAELHALVTQIDPR